MIDDDSQDPCEYESFEEALEDHDYEVTLRTRAYGYGWPAKVLHKYRHPGAMPDEWVVLATRPDGSTVELAVREIHMSPRPKPDYTCKPCEGTGELGDGEDGTLRKCRACEGTGEAQDIEEDEKRRDYRLDTFPR